MHYTKEKVAYEQIRNVPVLELLSMSHKQLKELENKIDSEVKRASIALKWIRGVLRLKEIRRIKNG